jgi:hypothetical protein
MRRITVGPLAGVIAANRAGGWAGPYLGPPPCSPGTDTTMKSL